MLAEIAGEIHLGNRNRQPSIPKAHPDRANIASRDSKARLGRFAFVLRGRVVTDESGYPKINAYRLTLALLPQSARLPASSPL